MLKTLDTRTSEKGPMHAAAIASEPARASKAMTTLIVHDQPLVGEGIKSLLEETYLFCEFLYASNADKALELLEENDVDLVFLGLFRRDGGSFDVLTKIRTHDADLPVVVLSDSDSASFVQDAVNAGASGYIVQTAPRDVLVHAINLAITGERLALMPLHAIANSRPQPDSAPAPVNNVSALRDRYARLTEQETKVLSHIREGLSNKEIARALGILEGTVKVHVKSIFRKMHAKNRTMAALMAASVEQGRH